jgi:two-component system phosphate regulon sensor histidine kinase PhoR
MGNEPDTGGAGLGLTVVKHIVEAHRGEIKVESKVGEGSSFTIILPRLQEIPRAEA